MYILLTLILCVALCFCVIYPLWLFSTTEPHLYSIIVISVSIAALIFVIARRIVRQYKAVETPEGKKRMIKRLLLRSASFIILLSTTIFFIAFVLLGQRLTALIILASGIAAAVILRKIRKRFPDV